MQVCHPDMPTGDAGRFRKITWAAEDPVGRYRLFTKWIVSDLSHLQCCSIVSRRTSLMLSLHESFGYTFGKMTSYSMGITWAVWVSLSDLFGTRMDPETFSWYLPLQGLTTGVVCILVFQHNWMFRFACVFPFISAQTLRIIEVFCHAMALRRSSTVLALVSFHFTGIPFSRLVGRYPQVHCHTHRGSGRWCRRAMTSNALYHAMLKRCEDWLADPFADEEGEQFDIEEFIAQVSEYVESVESGEEVLKARLVLGPF